MHCSGSEEVPFHIYFNKWEKSVEISKVSTYVIVKWCIINKLIVRNIK